MKNARRKNDEIIKIRSKIIPILKKYDVKRASIFGSVAKGRAKKKSDVDILVELPKNKSLLDLVGLKLEIEGKLKRDVDILTYNAIHPLLKESILKESVIIYEEK